MASYLILGAGKFGRLALERLMVRDPEARLTVVDRDPEALAGLREAGVADLETVLGDAPGYLAAHLQAGASWDWLIPMVPGHLALGWLLAGPLAGEDWQPTAVPVELAELLPVAWQGPAGELFLSRASHQCPDDCAEPDICPVTGEERDPPLYARLAGASLPGWRILVVASRQLAPGVGGYAPQHLLRLAREMADLEGKVLIATACRCHGVVHGLRRQGVKAG